MSTPKPRKGMILDVYRWSLGDCTNGGISSKANKVLLVGPGIPEMFEECAELPAVVLGENGGRMNVIPADHRGEWYMAGGNFAWSCDSRISEIMPYPVAIHDRREN